MRKRKYSVKKSKILRRRRKKQGFLSKFYFPLIGGVLFTGMAVFGLFYMSSQFDIKDVKVGGISSVSEEKLTQSLKEKLTLSYTFFGKEITIDNFFLPSSKKLSSVLSDFPQIESIDIKRDFEKKAIYFEVKEKQPVVVWKQAFSESNKCFLVDNNGTFIKNCDSENIAGLIGVDEEADICQENEQIRKNVVIGAEKIFKQTPKLGLSAIGFSLLSNDKLALDLNQGCKVFFNVNDDLDWELKKLEAVLKQDKYFGNLNNLQYIDVRFGNQAIIK
jgi:cell division septal protein FtsQ